LPAAVQALQSPASVAVNTSVHQQQ